MKWFKRGYLLDSQVVRRSLILVLLLPSIANAYTDPGSGLLLWQLLTSFFVGLLFYLKRIITYFKRYLQKK